MAQAADADADVNNAANAAELADAVNKGPSDNATCPTCGKKIKDENGGYNAKLHNGEWYHNNGECLPAMICVECNDEIDTTKGYIPSGPYHTDCYYNKLGDCAGCGQKFDKSVTPVNEIRVTSKLGNWHKECFKCAKCGNIIEENEYALIDNQPVHSGCVENNS